MLETAAVRADFRAGKGTATEIGWTIASYLMLETAADI